MELYWLEVPSKHSTITRGWRIEESRDMVVVFVRRGRKDVRGFLCFPNLWKMFGLHLRSNKPAMNKCGSFQR
jgi:hypothetical protein